jgi:hypothetical protein
MLKLTTEFTKIFSFWSAVRPADPLWRISILAVAIKEIHMSDISETINCKVPFPDKVGGVDDYYQGNYNVIISSWTPW